MLALLGGNMARCALRSQQWRSEQSLFTSALSVCPLNAKVRLCLTHFYLVLVFISYTILTHTKEGCCVLPSNAAHVFLLGIVK